MTNALVLLIGMPIFAAILPIAGGILWNGLGRYVAVAATVVQVTLASIVLNTVLSSGSFSYEVAGYRPPFGIELVGDGVSAPLLVLIALVALGAVVYSLQAGPHSDAFYSELLLLLAGLSGLVATGDVFNLYVFLEITGLTTYALVASGSSPKAAYASLKYLIVGTIGASFYLLGVGYLFLATGTLNMADLSAKIPAVGYDSTLILTGFAFIAVGLAVKVALFPLHTWQPDAYAESPHTVSAYVAALVSTAAAYGLFRIVYEVFTVEFLKAVPLARDAFLTFAGVSIIVGAVLAVVQTDLKRMLAYSSISHFGLIVAGFAIANKTALTGGLIHLVGHAVMKGGLFFVVGVIATTADVRRVEEFDGLANRLPVVSGLFAVLAFSMVGVPPAIGFPGKWNIVVGAVEAGEWAIAAIVVGSTLLTLGYFGRIVERMYFVDPQPSETDQSTVIADGEGGLEPSTLMVAVVVVAVVAAIALGIGVSHLVGTYEPVLEVYF